MDTATLNTTATLTKHDTCDSCGVPAKSQFASDKTGLTLNFCGHHTKKVSESLKNQGFRMIAEG